MTTITRRIGMIAAASLLGVGLVGVGATPAFAVTVSDTATLNAAITANETVLDVSASFTLSADIEPIGDDVIINGNGFTIDADGYDAFDIVGSATVSNLTVIDADDEAFYLELDQETGTFTNVSASGGDDGIYADLYEDAILNVTGGTFSDIDNGVYLNDEFGNASVTVSGTTFDNTENAIYIDNAFGTTSLTVTGVSITDAYYGVYFDGEDASSVSVSSSTVTAGPENNSTGTGYGLYTYHYEESTATIDGVTVTGDPEGDRFDYGYESAQYGETSVVITNSTFTGNDFGLWVDLYDDGGGSPFYSLLNSRVVTNAEYGAYFATVAGSVLVDQTTFDGNGRVGNYPSVYADVYDGGDGGFTFSRSTVSNTEGAPGIELYLDDADTTATIVNSTFSGNTTGDYSAIYVNGDGSDGQQFRLLNSTVTANTDAWSALELDDVDAVVSHSILSANQLTDASPAEVVVASDASLFLEWSLVGSLAVEGGGDFTEGAGVKETSAPGLGPLAANGGPTQTHALLAGSPALNAGNPAVVDPPATDQRGDARIVQGRIDIGAVEMPAALANTGSAPAPVLPVAVLFVLLGGAFLVLRRRTV